MQNKDRSTLQKKKKPKEYKGKTNYAVTIQVEKKLKKPKKGSKNVANDY